MSYQAIKRHGRNLWILLSKRLQPEKVTYWFQLYDILEKKIMDSRAVVASGQGGSRCVGIGRADF